MIKFTSTFLKGCGQSLIKATSNKLPHYINKSLLNELHFYRYLSSIKHPFDTPNPENKHVEQGKIINEQEDNIDKRNKQGNACNHDHGSVNIDPVKKTVKANIEGGSFEYSVEEEIKGPTIHTGGLYALMFTCEKCNTKGVKSFSKKSYHTGVVLIRCEGCDNLHLIADNLGWFRDKSTNIEDIAKEKGKKFLALNTEDPGIRKLIESGILRIKTATTTTTTTSDSTKDNKLGLTSDNNETSSSSSTKMK